MGSKYDKFWRSRIEVLRTLVAAAARGSSASIDLSAIRPLGDRASWAGSAVITGSTFRRCSMAHMTALGHAVADAGLCTSWPNETFAFSMNRAAVLTVRRESFPRKPHQSGGTHLWRTAPPAEMQTDEGEVLTPTEACRRIHEIVGRLPRHTAPSQVPFDNGLYFFFEIGEGSIHGAPRITRIGNHPFAQDRLVGRLKDHYRTRRDAKNGSVFRRYLGGALLRRDGYAGCLEPAPGRGHWERSHEHECDLCATYEDLVTRRLESHFSLSCVRIDDRAVRNHLEARLIAAVAGCTECRPSPRWLGRLAYPALVKSSGMWNSEFVTGSLATVQDVTTLRRLAATSFHGPDLSDTLLLLPCSAGKKGTGGLGLHPAAVGEVAARVLADGRVQAFTRTSVDRSSALIPALGRYSGQPYKTPGVVQAIREAMSRGLHVLIISGGYGVVRAEEPIHDYEAPMQKTLTVWRRRIPAILRDYVERNHIRRSFGVFSTVYSATLPHMLTEEDWRAIPTLDELGRGAAIRLIPRRVGELTLGLLEQELVPGPGWTHSLTEWPKPVLTR